MIIIKITNGIPYIWNADDWLKLRKEHRIVGGFDGAEGCGWSSQIHLHLPLRLSNVQTQFLIAHGIAKTVYVPSLENPDELIDANKVKEINEKKQVKQLETFQLKRRAEVEMLVDRVFEGKRKKGKQVPDRETFINEELSKTLKPPYRMLELDLQDPWVTEVDYIPFQFPMPSTQLEKLTFQVFEDFHFRRHYYLTPGIKFGGDFLAYPAEPYNHHSQFIIMCQNEKRKFPRLHILSQLRLAQSVKKTLLIAYFEDGTELLKYAVPNSNNSDLHGQ